MKNNKFTSTIKLISFNVFKFIVSFILFIVSILFYLPFSLIFLIRVKNISKLFCKGGKIIVCNHYSNWDIVILHMLLFPITYTRHILAKKELSNNAFSCLFLKAFGAIFIDREQTDLRAMQTVLKLLKKGKTIIMFPEGTRNKTNTEDVLPAKPGVIYFATKAKVPIVPIVFKHKPKLFRPNKLIVGEPYFIKDCKKEDLLIEADKLTNILNNLRTQ